MSSSTRILDRLVNRSPLLKEELSKRVLRSWPLENEERPGTETWLIEALDEDRSSYFVIESPGRNERLARVAERPVLHFEDALFFALRGLGEEALSATPRLVFRDGSVAVAIESAPIEYRELFGAMESARPEISAAGSRTHCDNNITLPSSHQGTWTTSCASVGRPGRYAKFYTFSMSGQTSLQIDLTSATVDTYLLLYNGSSASGTPIAVDDDSGTGYNSRINLSFTFGSSGTYTVEATTYLPSTTGSFTLSVQASGGGGGGCNLSNGDVDFCRDCGPCGIGEGDCDGDGECLPGLTCATDVGANYGFPASYDVCETQGGGGCNLSNGDVDFCRDCGPCGIGQGDCDGDAECQAGLICAIDVGANYGFPSTYDFCESPGGGGGCNLSNGDVDFCRDCGPCGIGQGDCDGDAECQAGLICRNDVGTNYGFPPLYDVCESPGGGGGGCNLSNGDVDFCRDCGPCGIGQGDCDGDAECQAGLICAIDVGANYGFPATYDFCESSGGGGGGGSWRTIRTIGVGGGHPDQAHRIGLYYVPSRKEIVVEIRPEVNGNWDDIIEDGGFSIAIPRSVGLDWNRGASLLVTRSITRSQVLGLSDPMHDPLSLSFPTAFSRQDLNAVSEGDGSFLQPAVRLGRTLFQLATNAAKVGPGAVVSTWQATTSLLNQFWNSSEWRGDRSSVYPEMMKAGATPGGGFYGNEMLYLDFDWLPEDLFIIDRGYISVALVIPLQTWNSGSPPVTLFGQYKVHDAFQTPRIVLFSEQITHAETN
ncbi:MAG: hypothetical protein DWQ36_14725 [Acidobacteria bacterium]|nr:MAG: hypothetical protein DWQ36_14725 [Acidobacteriota bacterium]